MVSRERDPINLDTHIKVFKDEIIPDLGLALPQSCICTWEKARGGRRRTKVVETIDEHKL